MLLKARDNSLILQAYIEFKKIYNIDELSFEDVINNGFRLLPDDDKNKEFFRKARLNALEVKNNLTEWYYYHRAPELECADFRFILSPSMRIEQFTTNLLDNDTKITYNT